MKYWISYTDGTVHSFKADSKEEARHYFMMEGDHAYDYNKHLKELQKVYIYGYIDNAPVAQLD